MERHVSLDFIRGVSVLGILLLNIVAFGLPKAAYLNPAWHGAVSARDAWTWALLDAVAQVKFLTLFALLFGAGLCMQLTKGARWIQTRLFLLGLIGLCHGLLLWEGDILLTYAIVGGLCWRLIRDNSHPDQLFRTGILLYFVGTGVLLLFAVLPGEIVVHSWTPDMSDVRQEQIWRLAGGETGITHRAAYLGSVLMALFAQYGWQVAGMMLIGATLVKSGWLLGYFAPQHYRRCALILIPIGLLINIPAITAQWVLDWDIRWSALLLQIPRDLSAPFQSLGYTALCLGFWQSLSRLQWVQWISDIGRMALTNYLLQTIICTLLFYHMGFFMALNRFSLLMLVPAIWTVNLCVSVVWLHYFRQGPLEWLWRRATLRLAGQG